MSLKLLQKAAASSGPSGGRGGRGRGKQGRTMSLQEFQQSVPSTAVNASRTVSAWGRGRTEGAAAGVPHAEPLRGRASRGHGARSNPEPRQSAWASGAPQAAVDALWDTPAATATVVESAWDEAAEQSETLDEQPSSWDEASWDAAPAVDWQGDGEAEADAQGAGTATASTALSPVQDEEEEDEFSREVARWLKALKLSEYEEAVLSWCEEMGAATLQEVVDCIDDLVDTIPMKPLHKKRMQTNGVQVAADAGSGSKAPVRHGDDRGDERNVARRTPLGHQDPASDAIAVDGVHGDDVGDNASGSTWCPGGSYYSRASSTGTCVADGGDAVPPQSFYGELAGGDATAGSGAGAGFYASTALEDGSAGGFYSSAGPGSYAAVDASDDDEGDMSASHGGGGFYASQAEAEERDEAGQAELDEVYLKQRYTERATWLPKAKVSQGERKKRGSQQQRLSTASEDDRSAAEEKGRRLLKEQLEAEERQRTAAVRDILEKAIEGADPDKVSSAIKQAREAGLNKEDLQDAEISLEKILRKQRQRRTDAVCALQAALEAPRDEKFGPIIREALEAQAEAREVEGGREVVAAAQAAYSQWQADQQKRQNAKMALQLAIRHDSIEAMREAVEYAHQAGLPTDDKLVLEASLKLQQADERRELDAAAEERLQQALDAHDLDDLPLAIAECVKRHLPLHGADQELLTWREEERRRAEATERLREAMEAEDKDSIRVALHEACEADVEVSLRSKAEQCIRSIEAVERRTAARKVEEERRAKVAAKRLHLASVELYLACSSRDAKRLEAAIAEGRASGVEDADLRAASKQLSEVQEEERLKMETREALASAIRSRDLMALHGALEAAEGVLPGDLSEVTVAREVRSQVERERRVAEEAFKRQTAEADLREAISSADWDGIQAGQQRARALGFAEDCEVMRLADSTLEELRDAHEVEEAKRLVENTEAKLAHLAQQEAELTGSVHKKARSVIGKEILGLKNDSAYLSAVRFLKNPDAERKRREDRRLASERRAAEESERRAQRCLKARQELATAISGRDDAAVQTLLEEDILDDIDKQSAEAFLVEQAERDAATAKDGALLQFSYASLDRRAFFGASIAMNEFLTDQYAMQEGADFKLKVQKRGNSVLVAFRSAEFASVVLDTAKQLAARLNPGHAVACAEICGPADFTDEVEEALPDARQDAENLQRRPVRRESQQAIRALCQRSSGDTNNCSDQIGKSASHANRDARGNNSFAALAGEQTNATNVANLADAGGVAVDTAKNAPTSRLRPSMEADDDGFVHVSRGSARNESAPSASSAYPGKGQGKGKVGGRGGHSVGAENTIPLPRRAADMLQRDRAQAELFHRDLKTFAGKFRVVAELQGLTCVAMKPMGQVHQETVQRARSELQRLLDHYFSERQVQATASTVASDATKSQGQPTCRCVHLRVSEDGAGIELTPTTDGFHVDFVEDFPGQDFMPGEVITEINAVSLVGLDEEVLEDTFGENFRDGAALTVMGWPE